MKTVWIVSEGSPGHLSQSTGLVEALAELLPVTMVMVQGRTNIRGWLRPLVRALMGPLGKPLSEKMLKRVAEVAIPAGSAPPDLVVSSGGKSVFAARTLAERHGAPYVFSGERKPYPAQWFHTVISPVAREAAANSIDVELIPTPVSPAMIGQLGKPQPGLWCMIIGGRSRSHRFTEQDWIGVAQGMNTLARREHIRWLLTTSRRTGAMAEGILKEHLDAGRVADAIWWSQAPRRELYAFMARAEVLFVTQDSVTMVTEAVSAGKPVVAIRPEQLDVSPDNFALPYFERLEANGRIIRTRSDQLERLTLGKARFHLLQENGLQLVAQQLAERLGWDKT